MAPGVFITGASGFVGRNTAAYLASKGHRVVCLSRSAASDAAILGACPSATIVRGDLANVDAMTSGMQGCEWVVHCAAKVAMGGKWKDFERDTVQGTHNTLAAAQAAKVRRFVLISSEAAMVRGPPGSDSMAGMDETRQPAPPAWALYSRSKAAQEKAAIAANGVGGVETLIVRPRFVWGKGDTVLLPGLIQQVQSGAFKWMSPRGYKHSTTNVQNLCEGIEAAALHGRGGEAYFILDPDGPVEFEKFLTDLFATRGVAAPTTAVPRWLVWMLATVMEWLPSGGDRDVGINRQAIVLVSHEVSASDAKARQELGYKGSLSIAQGLAELRQEAAAVPAAS